MVHLWKKAQLHSFSAQLEIIKFRSPNRTRNNSDRSPPRETPRELTGKMFQNSGFITSHLRFLWVVLRCEVMNPEFWNIFLVSSRGFFGRIPVGIVPSPIGQFIRMFCHPFQLGKRNLQIPLFFHPSGKHKKKYSSFNFNDT